MTIASTIDSKFRTLFADKPLLVRSPGRVNLIGEHTDYNHGYVLPAAIDKAIYLAVSARTDDKIELFAADLNADHHALINDLRSSEKQWPNYLLGVTDQLIRAGHTIGGFNCVFGGDIPIGAGLSSSAALEAGLAFALRILFNLHLDDLELVKLAQRAENEFVGVRCGIMDQYINIFGKPGSVLRIDCRSLGHEYFPLGDDFDIVLFDTCVSHSLASSEYNRRREECAAGVEAVKSKYPHVTHLRDVTRGMLDECKGKMDPTVYRRCKYVVEEDERVLRACQALQEKKLGLFGRAMVESHKGLSSDYEVSCEELDYLVELVKDDERVFGARMMGGGFGGCTINLVKQGAADELGHAVAERYAKKFGRRPKMYVTSVRAGTPKISVA